MAMLMPEIACEALGVKEYGLHEHTVEQELRTIMNRHLFATPEVDKGSSEWRGFKKAITALAKEVGYVPRTSNHELMKGRAGRSGRRMRAGLHRYLTEGVVRKDSFVSEMQKLELYEVDMIDVKEDRGIQFRRPVFNAALAKHLVGVEHAVINAIGGNKSGVPFMAKGHDMFERANMLLMMSSHYRNPIYIELDHSRFDAHVSRDHLVAEHAFYKQVRGWDRHLAWLLKFQLRNIGFSKGGIRYVTNGKRMSGDFNTGLGNSVLNYGLLKSWLVASGVDGDIFLDGDDSVIIIEEDDLANLLDVKDYMLKLGFVTEVGGIQDNVQKAEFCQSRVVFGSEGPFMCRNPQKWLRTIGMTAESRGPETAYGVMHAACVLMLCSSRSHPLMAPYVRWMKRRNAHMFVPEIWRYRLGEKLPKGLDISVAYREPSVKERVSFANAWDISPLLQQSFEEDVHVMPLLPMTKEAKQRVQDPLTLCCDFWEPDESNPFALECVVDVSWSSMDEGYRARWETKLTS